MTTRKTNSRPRPKSSKPHPAWTHRLRLGWRLGARPPIGFGAAAARDEGEQTSAILAPEAEGHLLTLGATGSGKSRAVVIPQMLSYTGSVVVTDFKGEIYRVTARARREMGQQVIALDPCGLLGDAGKDGFNPFDVRRITGESIESFALEIPEWMCGPNGLSMKSDAFWDIKGNGLISGVSAAILGTDLPEHQNVVRLRDMLHGEDTVYSLAVLMDTKQNQMKPLARQQISAFLSTEDKCRSGVLATAQERFTTFYDEGVERCLRATTFDLEGFRDGKPTTIYIVLPLQKLEAYGRLLRLWLASLLSLLFSRQSQPFPGTLFVLDEAAALGPLSQLKPC